MLPGHDGNSNIVYDEAGTVYCYNRVSEPIVRQKMLYIGNEPARETLKYRCPAKYVFRCHLVVAPARMGKGKLACDLPANADVLRLTAGRRSCWLASLRKRCRGRFVFEPGREGFRHNCTATSTPAMASYPPTASQPARVWTVRQRIHPVTPADSIAPDSRLPMLVSCLPMRQRGRWFARLCVRFFPRHVGRWLARREEHVNARTSELF